jgi:flagellar basal body-associated protein FliL
MDQKILELEKRLEKLEKIEKRRKSILIIKVSAIALLVIAILVSGYILYRKVEETLRPYKELLETKDTVKDNVNNGIDSIKGLFNKN